MSLREEQCQKVCRILDDVLANRPTERDSLIAATRSAFSALSAQPEIIRCKDCKYWDTTWQNDYAPNYHYCPMIDGTRRNDFYCAYAERREVTT